MSKELLGRLVGKQLKKKNIVACAKRKKKYWHTVEIPSGLEQKFKGVSIGYDKRIKEGGYFVYTTRARSKSYSSINKIPDSIIKRIEQTG